MDTSSTPTVIMLITIPTVVIMIGLLIFAFHVARRLPDVHGHHDDSVASGPPRWTGEARPANLAFPPATEAEAAAQTMPAIVKMLRRFRRSRNH